MRQFRKCDRAVGKRHGIEDGEIAALLRGAIDRRQEIAIALVYMCSSRHENRLGERVALRNAVCRSFARFEVIGREHVEALCASPFSRCEITVSVGVEREALVEAWEVAR